jgi:hypothetical protein
LSVGSTIARSSWYGNPRCRPRIIIAQTTSLLKVVNCPHKEVLTVGYPRLRPTLPLGGFVRYVWIILLDGEGWDGVKVWGWEEGKTY